MSTFYHTDEANKCLADSIDKMIVNKTMLKLGMGDYLSKKDLVEIIKSERAIHKSAIERLETKLNDIKRCL